MDTWQKPQMNENNRKRKWLPRRTKKRRLLPPHQRLLP